MVVCFTTVFLPFCNQCECGRLAFHWHWLPPTVKEGQMANRKVPPIHIHIHIPTHIHIHFNIHIRILTHIQLETNSTAHTSFAFFVDFGAMTRISLQLPVHAPPFSPLFSPLLDLAICAAVCPRQPLSTIVKMRMRIS